MIYLLRILRELAESTFFWRQYIIYYLFCEILPSKKLIIIIYCAYYKLLDFIIAKDYARRNVISGKKNLRKFIGNRMHWSVCIDCFKVSSVRNNWYWKSILMNIQFLWFLFIVMIPRYYWSICKSTVNDLISAGSDNAMVLIQLLSMFLRASRIGWSIFTPCWKRSLGSE